jgi:hypothetical protein
MAEFYRGKRVSDYRKGDFQHADSSITRTSPLLYTIASNPAGALKLKNIRGFVAIGPTSSSESARVIGNIAGFIALVRYPQLETYSASDVNVTESFLLHPVPFAAFGQPIILPYEFVGITLGALEKLILLVQPEMISSTWGAVASFVYASQDVPGT